MLKNSFRILLISFFIAGVLLPQAQATKLEDIKNKGVLKVGIYPEILPFTFRNSSGHLDGFDVDLISRIAKEWQVKIEWAILISWVNKLSFLEDRECDVFIGPMTITSKRAERVLFTQPHFNAGQVIIVRRKNKNIFSILDLEGRILAVVEGSTPEATSKTIRGAKLLYKPSQTEVAKAVVKGEAEAYIADRPIALAEVKKYKGKLKIVDRAITSEFYGYAVNKQDSELVAQFNEVISKLRENGELEEIKDKWF